MLNGQLVVPFYAYNKPTKKLLSVGYILCTKAKTEKIKDIYLSQAGNWLL